MRLNFDKYFKIKMSDRNFIQRFDVVRNDVKMQEMALKGSSEVWEDFPRENKDFYKPRNTILGILVEYLYEVSAV